MILYDKDIREPLFDFLESQYGKIRILEEKTMGRARADVVMITEEALYGIEIKSDQDTYTRLARQVKEYNQYYDYNYVVIGTKHAYHIEEHVPDWWGIITVEYEGDYIDFYEVRKPTRNPKINLKKQITILWRPELAHLQERNQLPKYKEKSKAFVQAKLLEKVDEETLHKQLLETLFERDYTTIQEAIDAYKKKRR